MEVVQKCPSAIYIRLYYKKPYRHLLYCLKIMSINKIILAYFFTYLVAVFGFIWGKYYFFSKYSIEVGFIIVAIWLIILIWSFKIIRKNGKKVWGILPSIPLVVWYPGQTILFYLLMSRTTFAP